jgi:short-subunit dehydrogenase
MGKIEGKRVLITGASSGIGKALAKEFAARGAVMALTARSKARLEETRDELRAAFPHNAAPHIFPCDVANKKDVNRLIRHCEKKMGGVDVLINNAGIGVYGSATNTVPEDYSSIMSVNFLGAVHCVLGILPLMQKAGEGQIINISSVAALHGIPYLGAYSASKAALSAFCQSLRAELAQANVRVMVVYPGYTQTDFFSKEKKVGGGLRPPGPYASPHKVARAIIQAVKKDKRDLVLSFKGKALYFGRSLFPGLVQRAMLDLTKKLKDTKEEEIEQAKTQNNRAFSKSRGKPDLLRPFSRASTFWSSGGWFDS